MTNVGSKIEKTGKHSPISTASEPSEGNTHNSYQNIISKFASHIMQKPKSQKSDPKTP